MDGLSAKILDWAIKSGYALPITIWFLWEKNQERLDAKEIEAKKKSGDYVSFDSVRELKVKLEKHLEKEQQEDIVIAEIKLEQQHNKERFQNIKEMYDKLEENQKDAFKLISSIKDHLMK